MKKYKWEQISFRSEKDDWKKPKKDVLTIPLNVFYAEKEKYILFMFHNITQIIKSKFLFSWFQMDKDRIALSCSKELSALLRGTTSKHYG